MKQFFAAVVSFVFFAIAGCGGTAHKAESAKSVDQKAFRQDPAGVAAEAFQPVNAEEPAGGKDGPAADKIKRKIKYVADFRLITEDFPATEESLMDLIDANDGFLSFADVSTLPGQPRLGTWKARVPIAKFESFRKALVKIAEVERSNVNTEDVTAQFYDLESHVKNQKAQEDALRELLKRQTDKMENMLAVQRELSNIRNSIERSEGQLRMLANLTDLTTISIHVQERRKYVSDKGPLNAEKPTFATRVSHTFGENWGAFVELMQNIAVAIVAVTPWLPLIAILAVPMVYLYRRIRTGISSSKAFGVSTPALPCPPSPPATSN